MNLLKIEKILSSFVKFAEDESYLSDDESSGLLNELEDLENMEDSIDEDELDEEDELYEDELDEDYNEGSNPSAKSPYFEELKKSLKTYPWKSRYQYAKDRNKNFVKKAKEDEYDEEMSNVLERMNELTSSDEALTDDELSELEDLVDAARMAHYSEEASEDVDDYEEKDLEGSDIIDDSIGYDEEDQDWEDEDAPILSSARKERLNRLFSLGEELVPLGLKGEKDFLPGTNSLDQKESLEKSNETMPTSFQSQKEKSFEDFLKENEGELKNLVDVISKEKP